MSLNMLKKYIKMLSEGSAFTNLNPNETLNAAYMSKQGFGRFKSKSDIDQYNFKLLDEINKKLKNFNYEKITDVYDVPESEIAKILNINKNLIDRLKDDPYLNVNFIEKKQAANDYINIKRRAIYDSSNSGVQKGDIFLKQSKGYPDETNQLLDELQHFLQFIMRAYNLYIHDSEFNKQNNDTTYFDISNFITSESRTTAANNSTNISKYIKDNPLLKEQMQENFAKFLLNISGPDMFISFVDSYAKDPFGTPLVPNIGINPVAKFGTPHGVYAYPFDKNNALSYVAMGCPTHAQFARKRKYFHLIRIDLNHPNVLIIDESGYTNSSAFGKNYNNTNYENDFKELVRMANILFNFPLSKEFSGEILDIDNDNYNIHNPNLPVNKYESNKSDYIFHKFFKNDFRNILFNFFQNNLPKDKIPAGGIMAAIDKITSDIFEKSGIGSFEKDKLRQKYAKKAAEKTTAIDDEGRVEYINDDLDNKLSSAIENFKNINLNDIKNLKNLSYTYEKICLQTPRIHNDLIEYFKNYFDLDNSEFYPNTGEDEYLSRDSVLNAKYKYRKLDDPIGTFATSNSTNLNIEEITKNIFLVKDALSKIKDPGVRIWKAAFFITRIFSYNKLNKNFDVKIHLKDDEPVSTNEGRSEFFALLLNSIGIKCVIDRGSGVVHGNEPSQMHIATFGEDNSFYEYIGTFDNEFEYESTDRFTGSPPEAERRLLLNRIFGGSSTTSGSVRNLIKKGDEEVPLMIRNRSDDEINKFRGPDDPDYNPTDKYLEYILRYFKPKTEYTLKGGKGSSSYNKQPTVKTRINTQSRNLAKDNPIRNFDLSNKWADTVEDFYRGIYQLNDELDESDWYKNIVEKINNNYLNDTKNIENLTFADQSGNMPKGYTQPIGKKPENDEIKYFQNGRNMKRMPLNKLHWRSPDINENISREILNPLKYKKLKLLY